MSDYQRRYKHMRAMRYDVKRARRGAKNGCYVATAVYGSYDCPEVWTLRRYRDNVLGGTWYGRNFIRIYYAISPSIVKVFGNTLLFKKINRYFLDRFVATLNNEGFLSTPYEDKDWRKSAK